MQSVIKLIDYRHGNLGDAMTNIVTVDQFIKRGYAVCGGDVAELKKCEHIEPDIVVVGGGGQIYETPRMCDGAIFGERQLYELHKNYPVFFAGAGFNEFEVLEGQKPTTRKDLESMASKEYLALTEAWKEVLDNAERVSLRDEGGIRACGDILLAKIDERYYHFPCPSFATWDMVDHTVCPQGKIAIYSVQPRPEKEELEKAILQDLVTMGFKIIFLPHSVLDLISYRDQQYDEKYNGWIVDAKESPVAALQLIRRGRLHVTTRLHGLVSSVVTGTPMLHIAAQQRKVRWQAEEVGLGDYKHLYNQNQDQEILEGLQTLYTEQKKIRKLFSEVAEESSGRAKHHFDI